MRPAKPGASRSCWWIFVRPVNHGLEPMVWAPPKGRGVAERRLNHRPQCHHPSSNMRCGGTLCLHHHVGKSYTMDQMPLSCSNPIAYVILITLFCVSLSEFLTLCTFSHDWTRKRKADFKNSYVVCPQAFEHTLHQIKLRVGRFGAELA